jgi:hypothetical protein
MGVFSSPSIPLEGLVFSIDAGNSKSYSGSGTNVNDPINSISGVMNNGVGFSTLIGGYFSFDGTDDKILYPLNSTYDISQSITIEAHIRPLNYTSAGGGGMIITKVASYYLELALNGKIRVYFGGLNSPGYHESVGTVYLNVWTHVAITRDFANNTINIYINGVLDRTVSGITGNITVQQTYGLSVGGYSAGGYLFIGHIACGKIYNRALSAAEVAQLYNATKDRYSYKADIIKNGLLLNYDISSNLSYTSPDTYIQSTINNYPGLVVNGPTYSSNNGGYLNFDGTNDHILVYNSPFGFTSESFTYSYWIYINSFTTNLANQGPIPYYKGDYQINGYYSQIGSDGSYFFGTNQGGAMQFSGTAAATFTTGVWYYISDVRNGSSVRIYVNGIDRTSVAGTHINPSYSNSGLYIGSYRTFIFSNIRIGNFKVYNRALNSTEILSNFNALRGRFGI